MWNYDKTGSTNTKTCTACKKVKGLVEFPIDNDKRDGLKPHCRLCHAAKNQVRRDTDPHWHPAIQENYRARQYGLTGIVSPTQRRELFEAAGYQCTNEDCDNTDELEMDHIVPLNKGGEHHIDNCQVLCKSCNSAKGDRE